MPSRIAVSGDWQELFQVAYDPVAQEQIALHDDFYQWFSGVGTEEFAGGDSVEWLIKMSRGSGMRYVSSGLGTDPVTVNQYVNPSYEEAVLELKLCMLTAVLNAHKLKRARKNKWMYRDLFAELVNDLTDSAVESMGARYFGDGTGTLALVDGAQTVAAGSDINVKATDIGTKTYRTYGGARYLTRGMQVCIGTTTELANGTADRGVITAVDQSAETIQLDRAVVVAAGDLIVVGDANGNEYNKLFPGLASIIDTDNTYLGIDRSLGANAEFRAKVFGNSNTLRKFQPAIMTNALFRMKRDLPPTLRDMDNTVAIAHDSMLQVFINDQAEVNYVKTDLKTKMGFETPSFQFGAKMIPFTDITQCPYNEIVIGNRKTLRVVEDGDWEWEDQDGSIFRLINPQTWAYIAFATKEHTIKCTVPKSWARIEDLEVPSFMLQ